MLKPRRRVDSVPAITVVSQRANVELDNVDVDVDVDVDVRKRASLGVKRLPLFGLRID